MDQESFRPTKQVSRLFWFSLGAAAVYFWNQKDSKSLFSSLRENLDKWLDTATAKGQQAANSLGANQAIHQPDNAQMPGAIESASYQTNSINPQGFAPKEPRSQGRKTL